MDKPCTKCPLNGTVNRYRLRPCGERNCEKMARYKKYLEKKRRYCEGDVLKSINDIQENPLLFFNGKVKSNKVIMNMTVATVFLFLKNGMIRKAVKKCE